MKSSSLQKRLGLGLTLGMTLLWLGATVGAWLVVQHELNEAFDSALERPRSASCLWQHWKSATVKNHEMHNTSPR